MRNAIGLAFAVAAAALVGVDNHSGLAQEQAKMKLAPPQVFQPPFPYSLGIVTQGKRTIYVAGQVALNDKGELVGKDDPEAQARQVFANMKAVLAAAGAKMDDVVKITMIIKNGADFPKIGGVRKDLLPTSSAGGCFSVGGGHKSSFMPNCRPTLLPEVMQRHASGRRDF